MLQVIGARESAEYISNIAGGYNVYFVHNSSHGWWDLNECCVGFGYLATTPVLRLLELWDNFFDNRSANARFLMICSSQGAMHVRNGLLDYSAARRERILVLAIAPAAYIYEETCAHLMHYRASALRDLVPLLDLAGAWRARNTTITLSSHPNAPWHDHPFKSPTFEAPIRDHVTEFIKSSGGKF